ncbi:MAG TPA: hypothetical protein VF916_05805 [Ktedonobacterales bacterium]
MGLAVLPLGFVAVALLIPPNSPLSVLTNLLGLLAMLVMLAAYGWVLVRRVAYVGRAGQRRPRPRAALARARRPTHSATSVAGSAGSVSRRGSKQRGGASIAAASCA